MKFFGKELTFNGFKVFTENNLKALSQLKNDIFDFKAKSIAVDNGELLANNVEDVLSIMNNVIKAKADINHTHDNIRVNFVVLKSPDGSLYKMEILDDGSLYTSLYKENEVSMDYIVLDSPSGISFKITVNETGNLISDYLTEEVETAYDPNSNCVDRELDCE